MSGTMTFFKDDRGTSALEFALVAPMFLTLIFGIFQYAYVIFVDNLLHYSVDAAARCGAVASTTPPCNGSGTTAMEQTAKTLFFMSNKPSFLAYCSSDNGSGLSATYDVSILNIVNLQLTAQSCYPTL
jgi:Flp pilus assembly protein TadG